MAERFGKYELLTQLGAGGMAVTYRAQLKGAAGVVKPVAIKRILPQVAADEQFIEAFIQEAKVCTQLSHANIAQVFDFGEQNGEYFLALEWVNGRDLDALVERAAAKGFWHLPVPLACFIGVELLKGLHHAHTRVGPDGKPLDLVHRDVSPDNVLIGFEGEVKLIDFGVAKARLAGRRETEPGLVKGKYLFFSPEQATAELALDGRSDVFAVGVMLYRLLAGRFPFEGSMHTALMQLVRGRYPPLDEVNPDVPMAVAEAVATAMQMNREERFPTAAAFADALSAFLVAKAPTFSSREVGAFNRYLFAEELKQGGSAAEVPARLLEQIESWRPPPRPAAQHAGPVPLGSSEQSPTLLSHTHQQPAPQPVVTTSEAPAVAGPPAPLAPAGGQGMPRWLVGAVVLAALLAVGLVGGSMYSDAQKDKARPTSGPVPQPPPSGTQVSPGAEAATHPRPPGGAAVPVAAPLPAPEPVKPGELPFVWSITDVKVTVSPLRHHLAVREANDLSTFDLKAGKSLTIVSQLGTSLYLLSDDRGVPQAMGELHGRLSFKGPGKVRVFDVPDRGSLFRPRLPVISVDGKLLNLRDSLITQGVTGDSADIEQLDAKANYQVEVRGKGKSTMLASAFTPVGSSNGQQPPRLVSAGSSFDLKDAALLSFAFVDGLEQDGPLEVLIEQKTGELDRFRAERVCQAQKRFEQEGDAEAASFAAVTCERGAAAIARDTEEDERVKQDEASDSFVTEASDQARQGKIRDALARLVECSRVNPKGCRCPQAWMQISSTAGLYQPESPMMKKVSQCSVRTALPSGNLPPGVPGSAGVNEYIHNMMPKGVKTR